MCFSQEIIETEKEVGTADLTLEESKLALEREKFEFDKQLISKGGSYFEDNLSVFVTALGSILAALIAALITFTQIKTSNIAKERELYLARIKNDAEQDRQWRLSFLDFLIKQRVELFSTDKTKREQSISLMKVCFPYQYTAPFLNQFSLVIESATENNEKNVQQRVFNKLLQPLHVQFERSRTAFIDRKQNRKEARESIRDANIKIRDLLTHNASLIPKELNDDARRLVEHFDDYLRLDELRHNRAGGKLTKEEQLIFEGTKWIPFPRESAKRFTTAYQKYSDNLNQSIENNH